MVNFVYFSWASLTLNSLDLQHSLAQFGGAWLSQLAQTDWTWNGGSCSYSFYVLGIALIQFIITRLAQLGLAVQFSPALPSIVQRNLVLNQFQFHLFLIHPLQPSIDPKWRKEAEQHCLAKSIQTLSIVKKFPVFSLEKRVNELKRGQSQATLFRMSYRR